MLSPPSPPSHEPWHPLPMSVSLPPSTGCGLAVAESLCHSHAEAPSQGGGPQPVVYHVLPPKRGGLPAAPAPCVASPPTPLHGDHGGDSDTGSHTATPPTTPQVRRPLRPVWRPLGLGFTYETSVLRQEILSRNGRGQLAPPVLHPAPSVSAPTYGVAIKAEALPYGHPPPPPSMDLHRLSLPLLALSAPPAAGSRRGGGGGPAAGGYRAKFVACVNGASECGALHENETGGLSLCSAGGDIAEWHERCARRFHPLRSVLTEIFLHHICSCHEILRMGTPGQVCRGAAVS
jgi:hypothetical protein